MNWVKYLFGRSPEFIKSLLRGLVFKSPMLTEKFRGKYFGYNGLDERLEHYINYDSGYFVELGANDGIAQSNTKYFELFRNWRGVLIEPTPKNFSLLNKYRNSNTIFVHAAAVSFEFKDSEIQLMYSNLMTISLEGANDIQDRISHAIAGEKHSNREKSYSFFAQAKTLNAILEDAMSPKIIDLLSLDVEGLELEVLRGLNHLSYRFKFMIIESRSFLVLKSYLAEVDYSFVTSLSSHDYLFSANEFNMKDNV